ncbi:MAG: endonuclease/exonuclease/phosphatase family protein [Phycisphaerae bacterium]|nr:endonuclease/exonuclease/phosphatase family protein [Phycisphaerae bacterium]
MRFLLYNIRYCTGTGWKFHLRGGYLKRTRANAKRIIDFIKTKKPDIVGLVEVDSGTYRTGKKNQAEKIAVALEHSHVYESKYGQNSWLRKMPLVKSQGNAFITGEQTHIKRFHYFSSGVKKLVIELEFENFAIFLVHLSLGHRNRHKQLYELHELFSKTEKPIIVTGDFNPLWGDDELDLFKAATGLINANLQGLPTYPSTRPRRQLDFFLHSPTIQVNHFEIPQIQLSDHMPIVVDFEVVKSLKKSLDTNN